jgi:hypothetical protein
VSVIVHNSAAASSPSKPPKRRGYNKPVPIPTDPEPLDVSVQQAMWFGDWSPRQVFRLISPPNGEPNKPPAVESFLLGGKRRIVFDSLKRYREACIAKGPQLSTRPVTGKRPVGRPRKPRPQDMTSQAG